MTIKSSTALRNKLLDTGPLRTVLDLGFINVYSGTEPADADAAIGGGNTLLYTLSNNSTATGLTLEATAADGIIEKNSSEVWSGLAGNSGTATFYRHVAAGDTGAASTTEARIQGSIGLAGADMNLSSVTITSGQTKSLDYYVVALPAS